MKRPLLTPILVILALAMTPNLLPADEGMWLFNNPPRKLLKEKYGFDPTDKWLEHIQKASVRFNSGGSGSFVSEDGLVMTNHHVGLGALQKLSKQGKAYVKDGFHATTWTYAFSASMRTASPPRSSITSSGARTAPRKMSWCSFPATLGTPIGSTPWRSSSICATPAIPSCSSASIAWKSCCRSTA